MSVPCLVRLFVTIRTLFFCLRLVFLFLNIASNQFPQVISPATQFTDLVHSAVTVLKHGYIPIPSLRAQDKRPYTFMINLHM